MYATVTHDELHWSVFTVHVLLSAVLQSHALNHGLISRAGGRVVDDDHRRKFVSILIPTVTSVCTPFQLKAEESRSDATRIFNGIYDPKLRNYLNLSLPTWQGTALPGPLSLSEACSHLMDDKNLSFNMGRWPDPMLRHPASHVPADVFQNEIQREQLQLVATALMNTARREEAVGLAAQQCGIDASLIYIDDVGGVSTKSNSHSDEILGEGSYNRRSINRFAARNNRQGKGIFLVNPRIIQRSPESEMIVWTEQCLVLPPEFRATLLRDAEVTVEFESLDGITKHIKLQGEYARCVQHEMDHDRGVLIVDHVSLDELLVIDGKKFMADVENSDGLHSRRMQQAYSRELSESSLRKCS